MLQAVGTDPELGMASDLEKLAAALRKYPEWRARIRRCDYEGGRSEGCYRYFIDTSPQGQRCCLLSSARRQARGAEAREGRAAA